MSATDWLKVTIERMDRSILEIQKDVQTLLLHKAHTEGRRIAISAIVSVIVSLIVGWFVKH